MLQSQDQLDSARVRYAAAVTGYNEAQVNLLAALGLISEHSLLPASSPAASDAAQ